MGFLLSFPSRAQGRISSRLRAAADVHFPGHSAQGNAATLLRFGVAPFGEVAGEIFRHQCFWEDGQEPEDNADELLGAALNDLWGAETAHRQLAPDLHRCGTSRLLQGTARLAAPFRRPA